jgi:hypothetical protein
MEVATKSTIWLSLSMLILGNILSMIISLIQLLTRAMLLLIILLNQPQGFWLRDFLKCKTKDKEDIKLIICITQEESSLLLINININLLKKNLKRRLL